MISKFAIRKSALLFAACSSICSVSAQSNIYSINVFGYFNTAIYSGDNLIANQLNNNETNTLNDILNPAYAQGLPNGATFTEWDPVANVFLPVSTYNAATTSWSINYNFNTFASGQGALLNSPTQWTNTFVGGVALYTNIVPLLGGTIGWHPNYANGLYLIANPHPVGGTTDAMFPDIVGRPPQEGGWVKILDPATQTYTTTTFHTGTGWDNGDPSLAVGEAGWVNLGPVVVPEPSALAILGSGMAWLAIFRRKRPSLTQPAPSLLIETEFDPRS